jgi:hypothetical protein
MKEITPVFEKVGKRRKLRGYRATFDGFSISTILFRSYRDAQDALDAFALDELAAAGAHILARAA